MNLNETEAQLVITLRECLNSRSPITVISPFEGDQDGLVDVPVVNIDEVKMRFQVKRSGDDYGKWFSIQHILGIRLASGHAYPSPRGIEYWDTIQERRSARNAWLEELSNFSKAPNPDISPYPLHEKIVGRPVEAPSRARSQRTVHIATLKGRESETTFEVKDANSVERVRGLLHSSYWETAHAWLICEFIWPSWIERNRENLRVTADTMTSLFDWPRRTPGEVVNLFLAKSWENHRVTKPRIDQLSESEMRLMVRSGLAIEASKGSLDILIEHAVFQDKRTFLKRRGHKVRNAHEASTLLEQYVESEPDVLKAELSASPGFTGKFCLIPPCNLSWYEWHRARDWHIGMIYSFQDYFGPKN